RGSNARHRGEFFNQTIGKSLRDEILFEEQGIHQPAERLRRNLAAKMRPAAPDSFNCSGSQAAQTYLLVSFRLLPWCRNLQLLPLPFVSAGDLIDRHARCGATAG